MNSKKYAIIFILLVGVIAGLYFLKTKPSSSSEKVLDNFTLENPEQVSLIFMTDQTGDKQIFLRKQEDGRWTVNDSFIAWQKKVDFLINETMAKVEVQGPAPKAAVSNILSYMSINGVKVEIYKDDLQNPDQVYLVGNTTPTQLGTYFKSPGSATPMIIQIPGFNGFVNSRYALELDDWISRTVFGSKKSDIESITVTYPEEEKSFEISHSDDDQYALTSTVVNTENMNSGAIKSYCNLFEKLNFETFVYTTTDSLKNALLEATPFCTIRVKSKNRGVDELKFYPKNTHEKMHGLYDKDGNALTQDPSRFYALYNHLERVLIVQDYTFGKVLQTAENFKNRTE